MQITEELALEGKAVQRIGGADLCDLLGISPPALTDLCKRGIAFRLGHDSYDMRATVHAYTEHLRGVAARWGDKEQPESLTTERIRLAKEKADAQALRNARDRRELVLASEVMREWAEVLRKVRSQLLAVPSRIRGSLPHLTASDMALMDREIRDSLTELANDDD